MRFKADIPELIQLAKVLSHVCHVCHGLEGDEWRPLVKCRWFVFERVFFPFLAIRAALDDDFPAKFRHVAELKADTHGKQAKSAMRIRVAQRP